MKSISAYILFILSLLLWVSCSNTKESTVDPTENSTDQQNEQITDVSVDDIDLSWVGTYKGVYPCDDCDGKLVTLTLKEDESYVRMISYLGKDKLDYDDYLFTWHFENTILLMNESFDIIDHFQLSNDTLYQLDGYYNRLTGDDANRFILVKESNF